MTRSRVLTPLVTSAAGAAAAPAAVARCWQQERATLGCVLGWAPPALHATPQLRICPPRQRAAPPSAPSRTVASNQAWVPSAQYSLALACNWVHNIAQQAAGGLRAAHRGRTRACGASCTWQPAWQGGPSTQPGGRAPSCSRRGRTARWPPPPRTLPRSRPAGSQRAQGARRSAAMGTAARLPAALPARAQQRHAVLAAEARQAAGRAAGQRCRTRSGWPCSPMSITACPNSCTCMAAEGGSQ